MKRRAWLAAPLGMLLPAWQPAWAQPAGKLRRVGMLYFAGARVLASVRHLAFVRGLRERGYVEGQNLHIEVGFADDKVERLPQVAAELLRLNVEVIVATSTIVCQAAQQQTQTLPIVVTATADPVGDGFALSLARPGKNITGLSTGAADSIVKHLEWLGQCIPRLARVAVLVNPLSRAHPAQIDSLRGAARSLKMQIVPVPAARVDEIAAALASVQREHCSALVVLNDGLYYAEREMLAAAARQLRLPMSFGFREGPELGMLLSYGPNLSSQFHRSASFVDKILRGAKPGDLPFEQPTVFELVINQTSAGLLGLVIPRSLLLRADEVIE